MEQHIEIVYRTTIIVYIRLFIETFRKEVEFKFKSRCILFWIFCVANFFLFFFSTYYHIYYDSDRWFKFHDYIIYVQFMSSDNFNQLFVPNQSKTESFELKVLSIYWYATNIYSNLLLYNIFQIFLFRNYYDTNRHTHYIYFIHLF